jgi:exonuclease SbcD
MKQKQPVALLLNDIHITKDNIPAFQANWDEALQICRKRDITDIVIGGDLWTSRSAQTLDVLMAVRQAVMKATSYGLYLTIVEGNHCKVDQESPLGYSHIFSEYPDVDVINSYTIIDIGDDAVLYVMGYFPENGSFTERLQRLIDNDLDTSKRSILYIHEGIRGGLATPSDDELPTHIFKPFDAVLVGHYHDRKRIAGTNIEYIGASRQHNFGEDKEKGYTVLYDDGSYEFVKNQVNVRYRTLTVDVADLDDLDLSQNDKEQGFYKTRLCVKCNSTEASTIDKKKLLEMGCTKVEVMTEDTISQETTSHTLDHKFDKSGIKAEYTTFCADKGIENVEMGLQYLDKIN